MKTIRFPLAIAAFAAVLPAVAAAQRRHPSAHLDLGGAPTGGGNYATSGGLYGRVGVRLPFGPDVDVGLDASALQNPSTTECPVFNGGCLADFPNIRAL